MVYYQIYKVGLDGAADKFLTESNTITGIYHELLSLGFKGCETKINDNGTKIYYKGRKNQVYVKYSRKSGQND